MIKIRAVVDTLKSVPGLKSLANQPGIRIVKDALGTAIDTFDIGREPDRKYFANEIVPRVTAFRPYCWR